MSKSTTTRTVRNETAAQVRAFYRADAKRMGRLSPEAQATVAQGAKGRLHPEVIADNNKRRPTRQYVSGAQAKAQAAARTARDEARQALRDKGVTVANKGPLPKNKG